MQQNVPLAQLTTIGIGGPARWFVRAQSFEQLREALAWAKQRGVPVFVLGGGSNLLIADGGFDGLVVQIGLRGIEVVTSGEHVLVKAAAGEPWDEFVAHTVSRGWAGIECLSGIPGMVGATPIQNVGAYGQEVCQTITSVDALDRVTGELRTFSNADCRFSYRNSFFKSEAPDRYIVLSVTFRLTPGGSARIAYPELQRYVEEHRIEARDLPAVREAVIAIRRRKGMVIDPADPDTRSNGSFFVNPILTPQALEAFRQRATEAGIAEFPQYPCPEGVKLSAAWLIERSGFNKGFALGNAGLSSKHTLAIINRGGATARDVIELVRLIQARVRERFGVELQPEPNFVGF